MTGRRLPFSVPRQVLAGVFLGLSLWPNGLAESQAAERPPKKYALVVGVREYRGNQPLPALPFAEADAEQLARVLERGGYDVTLMTQSVGGQPGKFGQLPTTTNIRDKLDEILGNPFLEEQDSVLLALAGHGIVLRAKIDEKDTVAERFFFCPMDAEVDTLVRAAKEDRFFKLQEIGHEHQLVSLDELYARLDEFNSEKKTGCKAGVRLMFVDACRNDPSRQEGNRAITSKTLPPLPPPPGGAAAFFSCSQFQEAKEDKDLKHGVFFHYVIEGLSGQADFSKDGKVTLAELNEYVGGAVYDFVRKKYGGAKQTPELKGVIRGQVALISIPTLTTGTRAGQTRDDNGLKTKLVWIPPGDFTMGSPKDEKGRNDDENQVQVTLSKGFWLGQYEVTQSEWQRVMQTTPWSEKDNVKEGDSYPATYASWDDAVKFCEKLTEQERTAGRLPEGWSYTLPTEAQWEYACRAGTKSRFSFGDDDSDLEEYAWFYKNAPHTGERYAHLVGQKKANSWGLFDMHGNVCEWCRDRYAKELAGGTDPLGPSTGSGRVYRGGCWDDPAGYCGSAYRNWFAPARRDILVGFRLAAVPSDK
jgi:sulfatase modifying factor 1